MISLSEIGGLYQSIPANLKDARTKAFAYACDRQIERLLKCAEKTRVWCDIENVDEKYLDYLAADSRALFYHSELAPDVKRELIINSPYWYMKLGTLTALEEIVTTVFGEGKVEEWFQYGGEPYHFRIHVTNANVSSGQNKMFKEMLRGIKRLSAQLDAIEYIFQDEFVAQVNIASGLRIISAFYPRYNVPYLYYDGTALYDGTYYYNQYRIGNVIDLYPAALSVQGDYQVRMRAECCKAGFGGILAKMPVTYQQDRITYTAKNNPSIQLDNYHLAISAKTTGKVKHQLHRIKVKGMKARLRVVSRIRKIAYVSDIRSTPLIKDSRIMAHTDMILNIPKYRVQLTIGYHLTKYDGTYCYDGSRKYDSKIIVDTL